MRNLIRLASIATCVFVATVANAQRASYERPPIDYNHAMVNDPVARLQQRVESGQLTLEYDTQHGYLKSVLAELEIPISSQTLVFSKTSMQLHRISPRRPRAVYFNDDVYVGWCQQGDVLELAATDANQGAMFYTIKQARQSEPRIIRDRGHCLACHASGRTQNVPGYLVRSVFTSRSGQPNLGSGSFTTTDRSPFSERWGGWYVTGNHGQMRHMGNLLFAEDDEQGDRESGANLETLDHLLSTRSYLSPHSDIVALMVLEHQTQMHNAITAANYEARQVIDQMAHMNELLERDPGFLSDSAQRRLERAAKGVVDHLLMCDEFPLTDRVRGSSEFSSEFTARGKRDARGRSLREFDLQTRLFRYPCSFLIHSAAFDRLPPLVGDRVAARLRDILDGTNQQPEYSHLSTTTRRDILEILRATKRDLQL